MKILIVSLSIILELLQRSNAKGTYTVLAPNILRPNRDFTVVVSDHGGIESTRITVQVKETGRGSFVSRQVLELLPDTSETFQFEIGELDRGDYNLTVTGFGGINFFNTTRLQYDSKSYSVFIQTDQAVYRPSDVIKFRAVVVNSFLKPSVTGAIDVIVKDGNRNIVKQWLRVFTNKGVFSEQIQLSEEPVLGNWEIIVEVLNQQTIATIMVAEYILPKFEVEVDLPKYVTFDDEQIVAIVTARYAHGRPVRGEVTLQVSPTYKYAYLQTHFDEPITVVKQLKEKIAVTFNIFDDLGLKEDYIRELQFTAYVKEKFSGRVQNCTSTVTIYRYPYKMQLIKSSESFKPGLNYKAKIKISYQDDIPVRKGTISIRHAFSKKRNDFIKVQHEIPSNGIIPLEFFPPIDERVLSLVIEAQFGNLTQWLADISGAQSPSNSFLQAEILSSESPVVGEEIQVGLNSTEPMSYIVFEIIGRGEIILAQTLQPRNNKEHSFRFIASIAMSPRARLVVYYVRPDGEVVADTLNFSVDGAIQNDVTLSINPNSVDAGQDVSITVTTKPNSFVAITATDLNGLFLGEGNHITENEILTELNSYDAGVLISPSSQSFLGQHDKQSLISVFATTTATKIFENSGVLFLTNGNIPDSCKHDSRGPIDGTLNNMSLTSRTIINRPFNIPLLPLSSATVNPYTGLEIIHSSPTRPPLAGPYAFSFLPSPPDDKPRIYLNKAIPKAWLFHDDKARINGVLHLREKVPDGITSYVISAFAIDDFYGLGVSSLSHKLTVFRPFFISMHVPSPAISGESLAVEAFVFNYKKKPITANVTIFNFGDFLFPDFGNKVEQGSPSSTRSRTVHVMAESSTPLSFMIVPQTVGVISIRISAVSENAVDTVKQQLIVKAEGETIVKNQAILVDLASNSSFSEDINITTPNNIVKDSLNISVSVIGDVVGTAFENLNNILQLPTGCGEQSLAKLMSNVLLTDYLSEKKIISEKMKKLAIQNMELGFQRLLTFQQTDGSFSGFGKRDHSGSVWLTAFVVRSLPLLHKYITFDLELIFNATIWLIENQDSIGSFKEKGVINNNAIQGTIDNGVPLTAYVIIGLLNIQRNIAGGRVEGLRNSINRGLEYISGEFNNIKGSYSLAISSYAFQIANHPLRDSIFYKLEANANIADSRKWWSDESFNRTIETVVHSKSLDVETTAYALLTYSLRGAIRDSLPIIKWLTAQRNEQGGFQSSQDTILGIMALTAISAHIQSTAPRLEIQIIYGERGDITLVQPDNLNRLQKRIIPSETQLVTIKGRGSGYAIAQVTYSFNVIVTGPRPSFSLDPQLDRTTDRSMLRLTICTGYIGGNMSNMAILDVSLPTGYVVDNDLIYSLYNYKRVKRIEKKQDERGILIYFDYLTPNEICPTITAYRVSKVAFHKKVPVKVYDYYDLSRQARQFYTPYPATLCDICDLNECDEGQCEQQIAELNRQLQDPADFIYPVDIEDGSAINMGRFFIIFLSSLVIVNFVI